MSLTCGCWELNPGPLEEQCDLSTTQPSLQPLSLKYVHAENVFSRNPTYVHGLFRSHSPLTPAPDYSEILSNKSSPTSSFYCGLPHLVSIVCVCVHASMCVSLWCHRNTGSLPVAICMCMCVWMCACMRVCVCLCSCVSLCVSVYVYVSVCGVTRTQAAYHWLCHWRR